MFGGDGQIRLVDFGLAKESATNKMKTFAGTPYFMAPEVLNHDYGQKCDVWSMGCVLYMLITGTLPFDGHSKAEVFNKINSADYVVPKHASAECKDLLAHMLKVKPEERFSAKEAFDHPWFKHEQTDDTGAIPADIIANLRKFKGRSHLRRATLNILVKMVNPKEFVQLRAAFNKIDKDMSGTIEAEELRQAVRDTEIEISEEELDEIIKQLDYDDNGMINYHEFISSTFPVEKYLTKDKINAIFAKFDVDETGSISVGNLRDAFTKLGHQVTEQELD